MDRRLSDQERVTLSKDVTYTTIQVAESLFGAAKSRERKKSVILGPAQRTYESYKVERRCLQVLQRLPFSDPTKHAANAPMQRLRRRQIILWSRFLEERKHPSLASDRWAGNLPLVKRDARMNWHRQFCKHTRSQSQASP